MTLRSLVIKKKSEALEPCMAHRAGAYPGFHSMKQLGVFLLPLDGMLVQRVKCLAQEHNTVSPARARTWTTQSVDERTNHEATAPPFWLLKIPECLLISKDLRSALKSINNHFLS